MPIALYVWIVAVMNGVVVDVEGPLPTSIGECRWAIERDNRAAASSQQPQRWRCTMSTARPRVGDFEGML